jgi:hypothetical protein
VSAPVKSSPRIETDSRPSARIIRRRPLAVGVAVTLFMAAACGDRPATDEATVPVDSGAVVPPATDSVRPSVPSTYDPALGAVLLLPQPGDVSGAAVTILSPLLPADAVVSDTIGLTRRLASGRLALFARRGFVAEREVGAVEALGDPACPAWPVGRLQAAAGDSVPLAPRVWTVALPAGVATGIPLDSIEALSVRDSAMLAAGLARVASGLAGDSSSPFHALPFTVTRAYRSLQAADPVVLATLVRRIPQEDRPMEERLFVVVSAPSTDVRRWRVEWHERVSGREEEVIVTEPLALLRVGEPAHDVLLLGRDDGTGSAVALLERLDGAWRLRWESPITGC